MVNGIENALENIKNKAEEYIELNREKYEANRKEKELELANMSAEERNILEAVKAGMAYHEIELGYKFRTNEDTQVKEICMYEICKEHHIKRERPSYRMDSSTQDSIAIVKGTALEKLDDMEIESWDVTMIIRDLYRYNPRNKSQPAIEKIRRVPDPRAVNPLLKSLKKSKKHRNLILSALASYLNTQDKDLEIDSDEDLIQWASKYALISLLQPYSVNPIINVSRHTSELIKATPEFAKFIADIGIQLSSPDPHLRIVAVKKIGANPEYIEVLRRIEKEDPDHEVRKAAYTSLKRNHRVNVSSIIRDSIEWGNDDVFHQENDNKSESYREINQRDFEAQIEENEEYLDDIISGLYR